MGSAGWRRLGLAWAGVAGGVLLVALVLASLGPLPPRRVMEAAPAPIPESQPVAPEPAPVVAAPPPPITIAAADPALLEAGPYGPVPRIAVDGRTAMRAYARPADARETRPRIGLVVGGLGLNAAVSEQAITRLPPAITVAINPYSPRLGLLLDHARGRGIETLMSLPMEPQGHPQNDAGDRALLTGLTPAANEDRLMWVLSRFHGYVGVVGALGPLRGERFAALSEPFGTMQDNLRRRGLLYIDPRAGARNPERAWGRTIDVVVDEPATRNDIDIRLGTLERLARERGMALGLAGEVTPVLLDRLLAWAEGLEGRGVVLVPVSSLIRRPEATR